MRCKRCNGLMLAEHYAEDELEEQQAGRGALRCVNCGAMVTVRMLRNLVARQAEGIKGAPFHRCVPPTWDVHGEFHGDAPGTMNKGLESVCRTTSAWG